MNIRHLKYFLAISQNLNFAAASRQLHISASPLSRRVRELEEELGMSLFERNPRKVVLTRAGQKLVPLATQLMATVDSIANLSASLAAPHEDLKLGLRSVHPKLRRAVIGALQSARPAAAIRLTPMMPEDQLDAILDGSLAMGTVRNLSESSQFVTYPVMEEEMAVALPDRAPFADMEEVGAEDLADLRLASSVLPSSPAFPAEYRPYLPHIASTVQVDNNIYGAVSALIAQGDHFAFVTYDKQSPLRRSVDEEGIVVRRLKKESRRLTTYLIWRSDRGEGGDLADVAHAIRENFPEPLRS